MALQINGVASSPNISDHSLLSEVSNNKPSGLLSDKEQLLLSQIFLFVAMTVSITGAFTNIVNIITFITMGIEDGVTTVFLSIAISDLTFVTLVFLRNVAYLLHTLESSAGEWWFPVDPMAIFLFSGIVGKAATSTTALSSTFMAVVRCMCVVRPLHFKNMFNKERCVCALLLCALFPMAVEIPHLANMGIKPKMSADGNSSRLALWFSADRGRISDIGRVIQDNVFLFITEVIVIVSVVVMIMALRKSAQFRSKQADSVNNKGSSSSKLTGKDLQVVKQVVIISSIYIICNIPKICHCMVDLIEERFDFGQQYYNIYMTMIHVNTVFNTLNSSLNFFVYFFYNTKFRSVCYLSGATTGVDFSKKNVFPD